ncbi:NAD-dependent succinate-semialdehyde dehydrogenase [Arenimonas fontis]|uniref:NAD-dependent succinate-semialdehyde dehydrogenase n=1 Tax=Arenimonas fontis TaxID=2608255 RepID=A0A5B2ZES0_9GAMM|nr:NAD-dependent succinate-semialdehyde dehydrogenase [Arenimonas fontis]KAA2286063.1 NAD-dependent succinate-semialdehyde dehydrogenase [Arenimonas fontis]
MTVENRNPWTGEVYRYSMMSPAAIEERLAAAERAFPVWSGLSLEARGACLRKVAAGLRQRKSELAHVVTAEMGKLHKEALAEVEKCAAACDYYADNAARYLREEDIATEARRSYVAYEPIGCVLAIMPWNFPIWQVFRFLAPTLMAGNVAVLKHATNVPRCADAIAAVLREADLPDGVFGVLHMDNEQAAAVIGDPRIKAVTLTGSERAGRSVAATAGRHLKKCVLELGGSDPFVVLEDADLDETVKAAVASRYGNAGQTCIAAKRFILVAGIVERFTERFLAEAGKLLPGDPEARGSNLAPMARADLRDGLHRQVSESLARGARLLLGGKPGEKDTVYPATVLAGVAPGMPAWEEELFGPVASLIRVRDEDEAMEVANATSFGLGASVWTADPARGEAFARRFAAGACFVNAQVRSDVRLPFGGTRNSGFGRELAGHGIHEFTNIKTLYVA